MKQEAYRWDPRDTNNDTAANFEEWEIEVLRYAVECGKSTENLDLEDMRTSYQNGEYAHSYVDYNL